MSIGDLETERNYVLCIGVPLEVCSEVARLVGPHAVVVAAADTHAARELLAHDRYDAADGVSDLVRARSSRAASDHGVGSHTVGDWAAAGPPGRRDVAERSDAAGRADAVRRRDAADRADAVGRADPVGRADAAGRAARIFTRGPLQVNLATREVTIRGRRVHLSIREFDLLAALASETDRVWSFAELTANVWRTGYLGDSDVVVSTVKRLRRRLLAAEGLEVASVRGIGYRLKIAS
ncbi:winged helix-turn-helix domain-containing protein [Occultella kanbiaonis]|uniref:winged helix-turn-helix domain-containing protein n=1 Tax=Occultella kanbiaonis TaxID=2675754 RepID=UPI00143D8791|nr:winged helix-turn-helix domain-containing protein [Occultella kanbiaonis]